MLAYERLKRGPLQSEQRVPVQPEEEPRMRSRLRRLVAACVATTLALAACGGEDNGARDRPQSKRGGVLRIAQASDATTLDQLKMVDNESVRVVSQITEPL